MAADNAGNSRTSSAGGFSKFSRRIIKVVVLLPAVLVGECKRILVWREGRVLSLKATIFWRRDSAARSAGTLADRLLSRWRGARSRRSSLVGFGGASICYEGLAMRCWKGPMWRIFVCYWVQ